MNKLLALVVLSLLIIPGAYLSKGAWNAEGLAGYTLGIFVGALAAIILILMFPAE